MTIWITPEFGASWAMNKLVTTPPRASSARTIQPIMASFVRHLRSARPPQGQVKPQGPMTVPRARPPDTLHEQPVPTGAGLVKAQVRAGVAQ
jgi:hypothetical protein